MTPVAGLVDRLDEVCADPSTAQQLVLGVNPASKKRQKTGTNNKRQDIGTGSGRDVRSPLGEKDNKHDSGLPSSAESGNSASPPTAAAAAVSTSADSGTSSAAIALSVRHAG